MLVTGNLSCWIKAVLGYQMLTSMLLSSALLVWYSTCWHQGVVWAPPSTVGLGVSLTYSMDCLSQWCWLHLHHPCWYPPCWCFSGTCWSQPGRCWSHCCLRCCSARLLSVGLGPVVTPGRLKTCCTRMSCWHDQTYSCITIVHARVCCT